MMQNCTHSPEAETCKALFGQYPEDVIGPIKSAADALLWLEEIFTTIKNEALNERKGYRIKRLADAGTYIAQEFSNYAGCEHETMLARLHDAGIIPTSEKGGDHE